MEIKWMGKILGWILGWICFLFPVGRMARIEEVKMAADPKGKLEAESFATTSRPIFLASGNGSGNPGTVKSK